MAERYAIYRCKLCGNIIESLYNGGGPMTCCGQPLTLINANVTDASQEKHVPVIEKIAGGYKISVGSALHPMEEKHYIVWVELIADGISYTKFFKPGDQPVFEFKTDAASVTVKEYCNLHGLWQATA